MPEANSKWVADKIKFRTITRKLCIERECILDVIVDANCSEASRKYVENKKKLAEELKITIREHIIDSKGCFGKPEYYDMCKQVEDIVVNSKAVIIQMPFTILRRDMLDILDKNPDADVDGFSRVQMGRLASNSYNKHIPCTASGIMQLIEYELDFELAGKKIVIVNRSPLIGKPLAQLALNEDMSVSIYHSKAKPTVNDLKDADVIVTGCDKRKLYNSLNLHSHKNQLVIDCSMRKEEGIKGVGDWDKEDVLKNRPNVTIASGYGHTGMLTVSSLMDNVLKAYML